MSALQKRLSEVEADGEASGPDADGVREALLQGLALRLLQALADIEILRFKLGVSAGLRLGLGLALSVPALLGVSIRLLVSVPASLDDCAATLKELRPECRRCSSKKNNDSSTAI